MKAERNHARLYRSSDDVVIAGVCAGVADYLGLPSGKVRLGLLVLVGGLSIWVYILLWIVVPKGPKRLEGNSR
jgi:phage shock protein C